MGKSGFNQFKTPMIAPSKAVSIKINNHIQNNNTVKPPADQGMSSLGVP